MSESRKGAASDESWHVDWESHRLQQLTAAMDASPAQRLAWLEETLRLAYRSGALKASSTPDERVPHEQRSSG
jgi:hypothetical protein